MLFDNRLSNKTYKINMKKKERKEDSMMNISMMRSYNGKQVIPFRGKLGL